MEKRGSQKNLRFRDSGRIGEKTWEWIEGAARTMASSANQFRKRCMITDHAGREKQDGYRS